MVISPDIIYDMMYGCLPGYLELVISPDVVTTYSAVRFCVFILKISNFVA